MKSSEKTEQRAKRIKQIINSHTDNKPSIDNCLKKSKKIKSNKYLFASLLDNFTFFHIQILLIGLKLIIIQQQNITSKISSMNIQEIRNKYKTILEDKDQSNSQSQWDETYSKMKDKRKKKILTEVSSNDIYSQVTKIKKHVKKNSSQVILDLKEKLAQTFQNLQLKNTHIQSLQKQICKKDKQIEEQIQKYQNLHQQLLRKENIIQAQKKKYSNFQKQYQKLNQKMNVTQIDNDLLRNQMQFYRKEIQTLRYHISIKDRQLEKNSLQFNKTNKVKKQNQRLRDDIRRLHFLINGIQGFRGISMHLQNKHFLGKPYKEYKQVEYWYPQGIINQVQAFLKRQQVAYGNKQFTSNLVKFVNRFVNQTEKCTEKKLKKKCAQKVKQVERRHNYSLNIDDVQDITLKKSYRTLNNSQLYKTTTLNQSRAHSIAVSNRFKDSRMKNTQPRLITESFVIDRLSKSLMNHQIQAKVNNTNNQNTKELCIDLVQSFKSAIQKLFSIKNKETCISKVKKLVSWLQESIRHVLQNQSKPKEKLSRTKVNQLN